MVKVECTFLAVGKSLTSIEKVAISRLKEFKKRLKTHPQH